MAMKIDMESGELSEESDLCQPLLPKENTESNRTVTKSDGGSILIVLLSTFVVVLGSLEFGFSVGFSSPTETAIIEDLGLTLSQYSTFGSLLTIGAMIGAIMSGSIADCLGRKGALRVSSVFYLAGWLAIAFSKEPLPLDIGRLFVGYGVGLTSYTVPVYIAEITPKNLRGGLTTTNQTSSDSRIDIKKFDCLPPLVIALHNHRDFDSLSSWDALTMAQTFCHRFLPKAVISQKKRELFPLSFWQWVYSLFQSLRDGCMHPWQFATGAYLARTPPLPACLAPPLPAKAGSEKDFEAALQALRGKDCDVSCEAAEIREFVKELQGMPKAKIFDLFQRKYAHSVIVGVGLMVLQQFGGINALIFYASEIFKTAGFASGHMASVGVAALQVPMTALGALLMDKSGRRPLLMEE
eukprot:Gb_32196 [translate_table: standard]